MGTESIIISALHGIDCHILKKLAGKTSAFWEKRSSERPSFKYTETWIQSGFYPLTGWRVSA